MKLAIMNTFIMLFYISFSIISAQDTRGRSTSGSLIPQKKLDEQQIPDLDYRYQLPFLSAQIVFEEPSGNNILDASETATIYLTINNEGKKIAEDCELIFYPTGYQPNITSQFNKHIGNILPGESKTQNIILTANKEIQTGQNKYTLKILEKSGFDLDPEKIITIHSREFQPPVLEVVDYGIVDASRNSKIEKAEMVDVTFRIQNRGENTSYGTYASIVLGKNIVAIDVNDSYEIGELNAGEYQDITAKIATTNRTKLVRLSVNVFESTNKYTSFTTIEVPVNTIQKSVDEIVIATNITQTFILDVANLKLDIAENIPVASEKKDRAIAVIIGNKTYEYPSVPDVDFAINDAALMKNYVEKTLGYSPENIIYVENATQSDLNNIFGKETNYKGKLYNWTVKGRSEVFIYYSGHGAPNPDTKQGYMIPIDCDPNNVALNGYSLKTLYSNLDKIADEKELVHVTVVLDACFSGNSQGGNLLNNMSPIYMTVKNYTMNYPYSSVFTSASGDEVSTWYRDKKQSLFTYFFLKGLKGEADYNDDNTITTKELYEYTADEINGVPYWARRLNGNSQTPTFVGDDFEIFK